MYDNIIFLLCYIIVAHRFAFRANVKSLPAVRIILICFEFAHHYGITILASFHLLSLLSPNLSLSSISAGMLSGCLMSSGSS